MKDKYAKTHLRSARMTKHFIKVRGELAGEECIENNEQDNNFDTNPEF